MLVLVGRFEVLFLDGICIGGGIYDVDVDVLVGENVDVALEATVDAAVNAAVDVEVDAAMDVLILAEILLPS